MKILFNWIVVVICFLGIWAWMFDEDIKKYVKIVFFIFCLCGFLSGFFDLCNFYGLLK